MEANGQKLINDTPKFKNLISANEKESIKKEKLSFSFVYFRQIERFQIGSCNINWFVGLIDRLAALSDLYLEDLMENNKGSKTLRFHSIDWSAKNIPLSLDDLSWLPKEIRNNKVEIPIMQISISTSTGRIIGFLDKSIFNVVLLDPNHNLQPSKINNYKIRNTSNGISQYDALLSKLNSVNKIIEKCTHKDACIVPKHINGYIGKNDNVIYAFLDNDFYSQFQEQIKKHSIQDIIESGILSLID